MRKHSSSEPILTCSIPFLTPINPSQAPSPKPASAPPILQKTHSTHQASSIQKRTLATSSNSSTTANNLLSATRAALLPVPRPPPVPLRSTSNQSTNADESLDFITTFVEELQSEITTSQRAYDRLLAKYNDLKDERELDRQFLRAQTERIEELEEQLNESGSEHRKTLMGLRLTREIGEMVVGWQEGRIRELEANVKRLVARNDDVERSAKGKEEELMKLLKEGGMWVQDVKNLTDNLLQACVGEWNKGEEDEGPES